MFEATSVLLLVAAVFYLIIVILLCVVVVLRVKTDKDGRYTKQSGTPNMGYRHYEGRLKL